MKSDISDIDPVIITSICKAKYLRQSSINENLP